MSPNQPLLPNQPSVPTYKKYIPWIAPVVVIVILVVILFSRRRNKPETTTDRQEETLKDILPEKLDCTTCAKKMNPNFLIPETELCNDDYSSLPCTELDEIDDVWKLRNEDCSGENCDSYTGSYIYDESNNKQCKIPKTHTNKLEEVSVQRGRLSQNEWRYKQDYPDLQKLKGDTYVGEWKFENCGPADFTCTMDNGIDCNQRVCKPNTNSCASETVGDLDGISFNKDGFIIDN